MITLAAHCVDEGTPEEIFLGDTTDHDMPGRRVAIESCHQKGGQQAGEDFAYCILAEPVNDVSIIPILYGCELELLQPGQQAVLVGFGNIDEDTPSPNGHKRWVEAPIQKIEKKTIDVGEKGHSNCFGDSGGPAYLQLPDGSWRVFGATSTSYVVNGVACANEGTWALTPHYVPWIEVDSGLDVTPCYDADGTWNPGPSCGKVPLNPEESTGTWPELCRQTEQLSGPLSSCGDPFEPPISVGGAGGQGGSGGTASAGGGGGGASGAASGGVEGFSGNAGAAAAAAGNAGVSVAGGSGGDTSGSQAGSAGATTGVAGSSDSGVTPTLGVATPSSGEVLGSCSCRLAAQRSGSSGAAALLGLALTLVGLGRRRAYPRR